MTISSAQLAALNTRYNILFNRTMQATTTTWRDLAMEVTSRTKTEHYPFMGNFPRFREWLGDRQFKQITQHDYSLTNRKFEITTEFPQDTIEDDQYGFYDNRVEELARQAAFWPEDMMVDVLNAAGSTVGYDGQYFFDTDHPLDGTNPGSGVQANLITSSPLNEANLAIGLAKFRTLTDEHGRPLRIRPSLLVVPAHLENTARKLVDAENISQTGGSTQTNTGLRGRVQVYVLEQLDRVSTTTWYLFDTSRPIKPFIVQVRIAPQFQTPADFNDHLSKTDMLVYGARARGAAGIALWQLGMKFTA